LLRMPASDSSAVGESMTAKAVGDSVEETES